MRTHLTRAPWWWLSVIFGVFFAAWMVVIDAFSESGTGWTSVVGSVVGGAVFGLFMGPIIAKQNRKRDAAISDVESSDLRSVYRASWRGPVPTDPTLRSAASRVADHSLRTILRQRVWASIMFAAFAVASAVWATTDSSWWLLATAGFVVALAQQWYWPFCLRQRLGLLARSSEESTQDADREKP